MYAVYNMSCSLMDKQCRQYHCLIFFSHYSHSQASILLPENDVTSRIVVVVKWKQQGSAKCWYISTQVQGVVSQKIRMSLLP
jgi:hypothetical protein